MSSRLRQKRKRDEIESEDESTLPLVDEIEQAPPAKTVAPPEPIARVSGPYRLMDSLMEAIRAYDKSIEDNVEDHEFVVFLQARRRGLLAQLQSLSAYRSIEDRKKCIDG